MKPPLGLFQGYFCETSLEVGFEDGVMKPASEVVLMVV